MKVTLYSLRTKKMELDRRILEKQSTIDSLRDEQKTIDVALQEKQNEIKMLREKEVETGKENPQVLALMESLKQKETELEDLRHRLESHVMVRSVPTDDPSNPRVESTMSEERNEQFLESSSYKGENESVDDEGRERESADFSDGKSTRRVKIGSQRSAENTRQKQESSEDEDQRQEATDRGVREVDGKGSEITKDHKEGEVKDSQEIENQKPDGVLKIGRKVGTETENYVHTNKVKGKKWRYIARKRRLDDQWRLMSKNRKLKNDRNLDGTGVISKVYRKFSEGEASNEEKSEEEYPMEATNPLDSVNTKFPKKIAEDDRENKTEISGKMSKSKQYDSAESNIKREDGEGKQDDKQLGGGELEDSSIEEQNPGEQEEPNDFKNEEKQEPEREAEGRVSRESSSDVKEFKEETEESEY